MSTTDSQSLETEFDGQELELLRKRLECEKLQAEIDQTRLSWWKRPGYIGGLAPIVIALVGFASAFAAGYFDTRREVLESQVGNLESQRTQLTSTIASLEDEQEALSERNRGLIAENQRIQEQVDKTYISLKVAGSDLFYAVSHLRACGPPMSDEQKAALQAGIDGSEDPTPGLLRSLMDCHENVHVLLPIVGASYQDYSERLSSVPASEWAKALTPEIGPIPILRSPDGRVYHPGTSTFYENLDALNRSLGN